MRGLVKWVWRRKIILAAASSVAGLVMTKRRQAKLASEAPAPAYQPPPVKPAPVAASVPAPEKPAPEKPAPEKPAQAKPAQVEPKPAPVEPKLEPTPEPVAATPPPAVSQLATAPPAEVPAGAVPTGAVAAGPDGSAPSDEYVVKGKLRSKIFHTEASTNYTRTKADVWFKNAADAEAAGFRGAKELKRPGT